MSSMKIAHFVPIGQQIWPPHAILVSDWLISKKSSPLKLLSHMNRNLVGSIYMYGRFCIKFPQSRMKDERHRLSPLSLQYRFIEIIIINFRVLSLLIENKDLQGNRTLFLTCFKYCREASSKKYFVHYHIISQKSAQCFQLVILVFIFNPNL